MGIQRGMLVAIICITLLFSTVQAQELIIFGDSLSDSGPRDVGGGYTKWLQGTLRRDVVFPEYPYAPGRWSNGPVWPEYASEILGIQLENWASGGATTGAGLSQAGPFPAGYLGFNRSVEVLAPNLEQQLDQFYLSSNNTADPNAVYVVFMGNNDYFSLYSDGENVTAQEVVGYIDDAIEDLYEHGARKFIVVTIPPVAALPTYYLQDQTFVEAWSQHNVLLQDTLKSFNSTKPGAALYVFDFEALVIKVAFDANSFGFTNATSPCQLHDTIDAVADRLPACSDPDRHLFWDSHHPSTAAHKIIGQAFAQQFASVFGKTALPTLGGPAAAPRASGRKLLTF